ncbi:MAG: MdtA/MuxA family multidrug efflux RND transporter periplasmic adaptor subunit [Acidobacteriia bacterium]|nr:MdtA/MuxA family multidrug efflux RND transporter periplasmic adaptor subunit [Terriglobia bacterium]
MSRVRIVVILACILLAVIATAALIRTKKTPKGPAPNAANRGVPVLAEPVVARDVPVYLRGLGSVSAFNTVTVRARVDGQITKINFQEGQEVQQGQLLVQIDVRPFEAALHTAEANLAKDEASQADAKLNLSRFTELYKAGVISQQQYNTQQSMVGQLTGAIGADNAAIENAKLQITYSHITAPIGGRIGLRLVDIGNMVHATDQNGLVVITQMHPIAVLFTLPEDYIPQVLQHMRKGPLSVEAYSRDDKTKLASGKLLTLNNEIDPTTGTNKYKAVFQNEDRALWPNQFVNVRLLLETMPNALTVPVAAIQRGSQGIYTYVVKPDYTVEARVVKVGVTEGNVASIEAGLKAGELVVTDGQDKLQPGAKVEVQQRGNRGNGAANASGAPGS